MTENEQTINETIDGAEEVRDPLEGLVERTRIDPSAPFTPEVLAALAALKKDDRAAFEKLREQLKAAGCRVTALDEALADASGGLGHKPTQADILVDIAQAAELFHTADGTGFADLDVNGHRETWPIRSKGFRRWLARQFFEQTDGAPNSEALQAALNVIEAKAHFDAPEREVFVRVGGLDGRIYLDLCDEAWRAMEIDSAGWRVIDTPPVRFRRANGMLPLPVPVPGGSIDDLRPYLNVKSDADFILSVAWTLAALRDRGPYPPLTLLGEHGTAKSTAAEMLQTLIDPNSTSLRTLPREDRDLFIAATNRHVLAYDNISFLAEWISDSLCRLATGGGFSTRQLYTDQDEVLLNAIRPMILNGIEEVVNRPDLADRTIFLTFEKIPDDKRRSETELWAAFEADHPRTLGALLDAVAMGLKRLPEIRLEQLPRMADFAIWATACEGGLRHKDGTAWEAGTFMKAYAGNIDEAVEIILNASPVASAVRDFMGFQPTWTGTATDLFELLGRVAGEKAIKAKTWPTDATRLGGRLRRAATFLRKVGIEIDIQRRHGGTRIITITKLSEPDSAGSSASAASADANGRGTDANAGGAANICASVNAHPLKNTAEEDAADAKLHTLSVSEEEELPYLCDKDIRQFAKGYSDVAAMELEQTGDVDRTALERWLRESLATVGVPPQSIETDFNRIMVALTTLQ